VNGKLSRALDSAELGRYRLTFPSRDALEAALATESVSGSFVRGVSIDYGFLSVAAPRTRPEKAVDLAALGRFGAALHPEPFYEIESDIFSQLESPAAGDPTLDDVLHAIRCPELSF